jgi:small subunit ribosomal protein S2
MNKVQEPSVKVAEVKQLPAVTLPTLEELLEAGSHFGHKTSGWNPKMKQYIYEERNSVHIIDLVKTLTKTKQALAAIQKAAVSGSVLIVGTKGQAATMVQQMALQKGAFYVNKRWPGGMFTNFRAIKKSIDNLVKMENILASGAAGMVKKEQLLMEREVERLNKIYEGVKFMEKLPTLVVVVDSKVEKNAIRECLNKEIPVVALLDTNCDPTNITFPIPANDDSLKSISIFVELFGKALDGSKTSAQLIQTRTSHVTSLENQKAIFAAEVERVRAMEEAEKERVKALKQGKIDQAEQVKVVRVFEKPVNPLSIESTDLGVRTKKALATAGIESIDQLKGLKKSDLVAMKGISDKSADEVLKLLK